MTRRLLIELAHLIVGLLAIALMTEAAAWSYPSGRGKIVWVGRIIALAFALWSIPPIRAALTGRNGRG